MVLDPARAVVSPESSLVSPTPLASLLGCCASSTSEAVSFLPPMPLPLAVLAPVPGEFAVVGVVLLPDDDDGRSPWLGRLLL